MPAPNADDLEVLHQLIDDEGGDYRVRAGKRVHYLWIGPGVFERNTMRRPYLLLPRLPSFPASDWTKMRIARDFEGSIQSSIHWDPLPALETIWHPIKLEAVSLKSYHGHKPGVDEVLYNGKPAIAKIASFEWQIARIDSETRAYEHLEQWRDEEPQLVPRFLAHLTENGRVMGMLLEKVEGEFATVEDLALCEAAVRRMHGMGVVHGDVNKHNFLIDRSRGVVRMLDLEHAEPWAEAAAAAELASLKAELLEDTGRGGPGIITIVGPPADLADKVETANG